MAVLALSFAGAALGSAVGGTFLGVTAASWGWMAGSMLGNALFAEDVEGPRLADKRVTGSEYGETIPWIKGSPRISGQIIWASEKRETKNTQSAKGGPEVTTYTYDCDLLIMLTENEIVDVSRIWLNSELVYGNGLTKDGIWSSITIYKGTDDQMPDPTYEAAVGLGNAPAYRGRGYVVIAGLQLGGGGQIPNLTFEVGSACYTTVRSSDVFYLYRPTNNGNQFSDLSLNDFGEPTGGYSIVGDGVIHIPAGNYAVLNRITDGSMILEGDFTIDLEFQHDEGSGSFITALYTFGESQSSGRYLGAYLALETISDPPTKVPPAPLKMVIGNGHTPMIYTIAGDQASALEFLSEPHYLIVMRKDQKLSVQLDGNVIFDNITSTSTILPLNEYCLGAYEDIYHAIGTQNGLTITNFRLAKKAMYESLHLDLPERPLTDDVIELNYVFGEKVSAPVGLATSELMIRSNYKEKDFDITDLSEIEKPLRGTALGQVAATRGVLESLQTAWFFEASKSDKIYIKQRSESSIVTIPFSDLGTSNDPISDSEPMSLIISNELEIPAQIALSYPSMEQDYQTATEISDRLLSGQESTKTLSLGIGMTATEAKGIADALVFDQVAALTKTTLRVPLKYAYVEPGDIVTAINADGRSYRLRVHTKRDSLNIIELECVLDDVGALESAAITDSGYITVDDPISVAQTEFEALDIPLMRDVDNNPGYYIACGPVITNPDNYEWKGALVARSWNNTDYAELFQTTTQGTFGTCSNTLGNWTGGNIFDDKNALTVVTTGNELSSATRENMQLDASINVAAVGSQASGWEIIRFINATLTGENTYVLTGLHRGFRGTEHLINSHGSNEQFILINSAVIPVQTQTSEINIQKYIKAATFGFRLSDVTEEPFTDTGIILKPFSPVNGVALADGTDIVATWQRRTRLSYQYGGATPTVPIGESSEQYRVRIYDGSTLVRTETVNEPTYTYAEANIAADGFASSDTVSFEVCQLSEIIGAGYPLVFEGVTP